MNKALLGEIMLRDERTNILLSCKCRGCRGGRKFSKQGKEMLLCPQATGSDKSQQNGSFKKI